MEHAGSALSGEERRRGFIGLYFGRMVMSVCTGLLGVFLPIFLYNLFDGNIHKVTIYYASSCIIYLFLVALGAQFLNTFGFKKALILANVAAAGLYATYYFTNTDNAWLLIPLSIILLVMFRVFFWVPYHTDFAIFTRSKKRGGQVGLLLASLTLIGVVGPLLAGYLIAHFGIPILFLISLIAFLAGIIPFALIPRTNERFSWNYTRSWHELVAKKNRHVVLASVAAGAEDTIGLIVWPIFIFVLLEGNYFQVGALSSIITGVTVLLQLFLGRHLDGGGDKKHILKTGSLFYAIGWIAKIFVATAFQIFIAGLYHKFTKIFIDTSFDTIYYELAADQGHYVDEFTVLSETAIQIGKIISFGAVSLMALYFSIQWTFLIGALAALFLNALYATQGEGRRN